jgi:hypothetical protein
MYVALSMTQILPNKTYNCTLFDIFHRMAVCYLYKVYELRLSCISYKNGSCIIDTLQDDITIFEYNGKMLNALSCIAEKIIDYIESEENNTFKKLNNT